MTRNHLLRNLVGPAILAAGLLLGACGGDAGDDGDAAAPAGGSTAAPGSQAADKVQIVDFDFKPGDVKVKAGTEVTWTNEDGFAHTVTADDRSFDSKNMDKDAVFKHRFDEAGTFKYFCEIHNSMTGSVTVE